MGLTHPQRPTLSLEVRGVAFPPLAPSPSGRRSAPPWPPWGPGGRGGDWGVRRARPFVVNGPKGPLALLRRSLVKIEEGPPEEPHG
jgi:hypothetical protein